MPIIVDGKEPEIKPPEAPQIRVPKALWNKILKEVDEFRKDGMIRAYRLITRRRSKGTVPDGRLGKPYHVIRMEKIDLQLNPWDELNYRYIRQKEKGAYKTKESGERYSGAVEIRTELSYTPVDAYWIGWEKIDFKIYMNSSREYRAYWVDHNWGKHYETRIELS